MVDEATKKTLASIPLLRTNAGPRDGDQWATRLKEEYLSLIKVANLLTELEYRSAEQHSIIKLYADGMKDLWCYSTIQLLSA